MYTPPGQLEQVEGQAINVAINTAKYLSPLRSDNKIRVLSIVSDIEVDNETQEEFKMMRYPIEDGKKHANLFATRSNWFCTTLDFDRVTANEWTTVEFNAFYSTSPDLVNTRDPGNTIGKLRTEFDFSDSQIRKAEIETKIFFQMAQSGLIALTPMKTYAKHRYHSGANTSLLNENECPVPVSFWTANGYRFANILSQLNLAGQVTPSDLNREILAEKNFVCAAQDFGKMAARHSSEHLKGNLDILHRQMHNLPLRQRPYRQLHHRGYSSDDDSVAAGPMLQRPDNWEDHKAGILPKENTTSALSEANQSQQQNVPASVDDDLLLGQPNTPISSENDLLQGQPKTIEIVRLDRGRSSTKKTMVVRNSLPPLLPLPPASTHSTNRSENPGPSKSARQSEAPDFYRRPDRSTIRASDFDNDPLDDPVLPIAEAR